MKGQEINIYILLGKCSEMGLMEKNQREVPLLFLHQTTVLRATLRPPGQAAPRVSLQAHVSPSPGVRQGGWCPEARGP